MIKLDSGRHFFVTPVASPFSVASVSITSADSFSKSTVEVNITQGQVDALIDELRPFSVYSVDPDAERKEIRRSLIAALGYDLGGGATNAEHAKRLGECLRSLQARHKLDDAAHRKLYDEKQALLVRIADIEAKVRSLGLPSELTLEESLEVVVSRQKAAERALLGR